jgi:hypothetical protein
MRFQHFAMLDEAEQEVINFHLRMFNHAHNGDFYRARDLPENTIKPLNILVYDDAGKQIGGLMGETQFAYVDTFDYQAPDFYRKVGFEVSGRLDNWDSHGHAKIFLTKQLA